MFDYINNIWYLPYKRYKTYIDVLKKISIIIFYSFDNIYGKILLSFDSVSPYACLLYRGIFINILSFLNFLVFIIIKLPDENGIKSCVFTRLWKIYDNKLNILLNFALLIVYYLYSLNIYLIIDKFSPIHFAVATILENIGSILIAIISGNIRVIEFFINIVVYIILILAALVYNEFIILNFCGFQKHTNIFLQKKANIDIELTFAENNENELMPEDEDDKIETINNKNNSQDELRESNLNEIDNIIPYDDDDIEQNWNE